MKERKQSRTAEAVAACRAYHLINHEPVVLEDPYAIHLTSPLWRMILRNRFLSRLVFEKAFRVLDPIGWEIIARARWAEGLLARAVHSGITQYVLLGAGMDSFALRRRDLSESLRIFELDHPSSQEAKRRRLSKLDVELPNNLEFVPIDFEKTRIADAMERSSFRRERPAFFSWLGVTQYLTRDAIFQTLESVAAIAAPRSEIALDYFVRKEFVQPADLPSVEALERFVAKRKEPFMSAFDPAALAEDVSRIGYEVVEQLSPDQQLERFYADHSKHVKTAANAHFLLLRLPD